MRLRLGRWLPWLATVWLIVVLALSVTYYTRPLDVVALLLALPVQVTVLVLWLLFPRLPMWLVAGHGLIMLSLALGLIVTGPAAASRETGFAVPIPWLVIGLVPAGVAMIVAAATRRRPVGTLVH